MGGCVLGGGGGGGVVRSVDCGCEYWIHQQASILESWKENIYASCHLLRAVYISRASLADRDDLFHKNNFWAT